MTSVTSSFFCEGPLGKDVGGRRCAFPIQERWVVGRTTETVWLNGGEERVRMNVSMYGEAEWFAELMC